MLVGLMNWLLTLSVRCRGCEESPRESRWCTVSQGIWHRRGDVSRGGMKFLQNRVSWRDAGKAGAMHTVFSDWTERKDAHSHQQGTPGEFCLVWGWREGSCPVDLRHY